MNEDLVNVRNWCFGNYLLMNATETKLMLFGSRKMLPKMEDFSVSVLGENIVPVDTVNGLSMNLDSHLTYDEHVIKTGSKCKSYLAQINRVKHVFDDKSLLTIINALVFSKLYYCSNVWGNTSQKNIQKLQAVQNFACRIVCGARKYDHITSLLK
jgi:hypothetical protein